MAVGQIYFYPRNAAVDGPLGLLAFGEFDG